MDGKTHPQWSGSVCADFRLYLRMPGLEFAKGDNFRVKFRSNVLTLSIVWPQKYKHTVTIGPFYSELDAATMNTTRKAEQVIVTFGKRTKARWEMITRGGEYASLPPNGPTGGAANTQSGPNAPQTGLQRPGSRRDLHSNQLVEVDRVFKQYQLGGENRRVTERNSPSQPGTVDNDHAGTARRRLMSPEDSSKDDRYSGGSRSPRHHTQESLSQGLRNSKSPPPVIRGLPAEKLRNDPKTQDKYQSKRSLTDSKGVPLKKATDGGRLVPQSRLTSNLTSRG